MELTGKSMPALKYFMEKKWRALIVIGLLSLVVAVFESLSTLSIYPVLALVTPVSTSEAEGGVLASVISWLTNNGLLAPLHMALILMLGFTLIKVIFSYFHLLLAWIASNKIFQETQVTIISSLLKADYQFLVNAQKGDLAYRVLNAPGYISKVVNTIPLIAVEILKTVMIIAMLLVLSPKVTFFLLGIAGMYFLLTKMIASNVSYGTGSGRARSASNQSIHAMNALKGFKSIRLYGATSHWIELFSQECRNFYAYARKDAIISSLPANLLEVVSISFICLMVLSFSQSQHGIISNIPILGVFAFSLLKIMPSLKHISNQWMGLMSMLPHAEAAYLAILEAKQNRNTLDGVEELDKFEGKIDLKDISFSYDATKEGVLKDIKLTINKGEFIGIIGYSGSGKTTLLDLLINLLRPSAGMILIDGRPLSLYSSESLSRHIGYVGQDTFLFSDSIRNNILFGRSGFSDQMIKEALRKAEMLDFIEGLPQALDFLVADDGMKMSGGQRQRLSIARAILNDPEILLLDEATSALDHKTEVNIMETILNLVKKEGKTIIFVTHRKSALRNADRVIEIKDGIMI